MSILFPEDRTFKHHITGRTINRDLNIPGHLIPEYRLPYFPGDHAADLAQVVGLCVAVWASRDEHDEEA